MLRKMLTVSVAAAVISGMTVNVSASTRAEMVNEYETRLSWFLPIQRDGVRNLFYSIYDIDKNGIPELIINDYYCATEYTYHIYTYDVSGIRYIGSLPGCHTAICSYTGNGLVFLSGMSGYGAIERYTLNNNKLAKVYSKDFGPAEYDPGSLYKGSEYMYEYSYAYDSDYNFDSWVDPLYYDVWYGTRNGVKIGNMLNTDIRTYINGYEIPCYSIDGRCVVVAEDLRSYGFDVDWFEDNNALVISRNKDKDFTPMAPQKKQKKGSIFASVLSTDIDVYYESAQHWGDWDYLKSYAMNGYMLISLESIADYGISFNYNDAERKLYMELN